MNKEEKQSAIDAAMAKLTAEEQELLGLVNKPTKPRVKRNYSFKVNYMIGDADGYTSEQATISVNNPFVKLVSDALHKLENIEGHWGVMLDDEHYKGNRDAGNISEMEYKLLTLVTDGCYDEDMVDEFFDAYGYYKTEENYDYIMDFDGLLRSDAEYSYLVYEGHTLK